MQRVKVGMEKEKGRNGRNLGGTWDSESDDDRPVPVAGWPLCTLQNRGRGGGIATGAAVLMSPAKQRTGP